MISDLVSMAIQWDLARVPPSKILWILETQKVKSIGRDVTDGDSKGFFLNILNTCSDFLNLFHGMVMIGHVAIIGQTSLVYFKTYLEVLVPVDIIVSSINVVLLTLGEVVPT